MTRNVMIAEAAILVAIVVLLVAILVSSRRRKKRLAPSPVSPGPVAEGAYPSTSSETTLAAETAPVTPSLDTAQSSATQMRESSAVACAQHPIRTAPQLPDAGTPAAWLPDPSGAPDTLRYWDGDAWTDYFARRA